MSNATLTVAGTELMITHADKVLFPRDGITKLDLARYYADIATALLPHVFGRPLTLKPFPQGIDAPSYYLRTRPRNQPDWLACVPYELLTERERICPIVATDARTLVWAANRDAIEIHAWLCRADALDQPDRLVFDLDPGPGVTLAQVGRIALATRDRLQRDGLASFVKTSGKRGLHVLVPIRRGPSYDAVRDYARGIAEAEAAARPDEVTAEVAKAERRGRVLIDYSQNSSGRSTAAAYSVRPVDGAPVSTPLDWSEVERGALDPTACTLPTIFARLETHGDVHAPLLDLDQPLPGARLDQRQESLSDKSR